MNSKSTASRVTALVFVVLLAMGYALAGIGKLTGAANEMFVGWGYPTWFAIVIGVLEIVGALLLLFPKTTRIAIVGLTVIMLGAVYTHLANGEAIQVLRPAVFLGMLWSVWISRSNPKQLPATVETD